MWMLYLDFIDFVVVTLAKPAQATTQQRRSHPEKPLTRSGSHRFSGTVRIADDAHGATAATSSIVSIHG
eukprot:scaffold5017_cov171-Amphora_coffeaeformis.AAC.13